MKILKDPLLENEMERLEGLEKATEAMIRRMKRRESDDHQ